MLSVQELAGKVAVVTGGASGIGRAIAQKLVERQMHVVIADIEQSALDRAAREIGATGIRTDVSSLESMQALAQETMRRFGGVDLFCSNAGVGSVARIADMTTADWSWLLNVNLWGTIHGIQVFLPLLKSNSAGGRLVITASEVGFHAVAGLGAYAVSKFAVVGLAETLALELEEERSKIGVTLLCPGPVSSRLGSSQRNRPGGPRDTGLIDSDLEKSEAGRHFRWIAADVVAERMLQAFERNDLYVFTHPEMVDAVSERHGSIAAAFRDASERVG